MIEESINNLTDEIRELKEVLAQLVSAYVKFELTDWSDVDVVHLDKVEQTEVVTRQDSLQPATVKNSPEPAAVKEMSDAKALAIVSGEKVEEVDLPSIEEMYIAAIKHVNSFPEFKTVVKEWATERNASSLRKVDESYRQECYDFLTAIGVNL